MQNSLSYFPRPKDMPGLRGWDAAVNSLAVNLALEERWSYTHNQTALGIYGLQYSQLFSAEDYV